MLNFIIRVIDPRALYIERYIIPLSPSPSYTAFQCLEKARTLYTKTLTRNGGGGGGFGMFGPYNLKNKGVPALPALSSAKVTLWFHVKAMSSSMRTSCTAAM